MTTIKNIGVIIGALVVGILIAPSVPSFGGVYSVTENHFGAGLFAGATDQFVVSTAGVVSLGTSTPSSIGDVVLESTGTTTLMISSSGSSKGACLQLESAGGAPYRAYATTTGPLIMTAGNCE